jgi:hypothetical protein
MTRAVHDAVRNSDLPGDGSRACRLPTGPAARVIRRAAGPFVTAGSTHHAWRRHSLHALSIAGLYFHGELVVNRYCFRGHVLRFHFFGADVNGDGCT